MDKRRTSNLNGKCGSCRFFMVDSEWECTGFCSGNMKHKGRIERSYKCKGYENAPTIIEASPYRYKMIGKTDKPHGIYFTESEGEE